MQNVRDSAARAITEIGAPWTWNILGALIVGAATRSLGWGIASALTMGVLPMIGVMVMSARGATISHHVPERKYRPMIAAVVMLLVVVVLIAMIGSGVTGPMLAVQTAGLVAVTSLGLVSRWWQISFHATVAVGWTVAVFWLLGWGFGLACAVAALAVCWSRLSLNAHTIKQLIAGGALGAVSFSTTIGLL